MRTTMRDVARRAGVSLATVSYVLSHGPRAVGAERRRRVLVAAKELNYNARTPRPQRFRRLTIGVVVPEVSFPFFATAVQGIEQVVRPGSHLLFVASSGDEPSRERQLIRALLRRRVDGVILAPCGDVAPLVGQAAERGTAVVLMDREGGGTSLNRVTINNHQSAFQAVRLLWESGHSQIALVNGPDRIDTARERLRGYTDALAFAGLPFRSELVQRGPFTSDHGLQATRTLLALAEPPSAIFSSSAALTSGVLRGLRERGLRVPDDIALVGFGDPEWASLLTPPLTVIEQPTVLLGEAAARLLLATVGGRPAAIGQRMVLETRLVLRESHWRVVQPAAAFGASPSTRGPIE